ncbi:disulfide bond formation protein DsbB [Sedimenticola sp.]|uniref:disulfide bond formation protein DsbB n=1 Tax=Sedimenticola sp. TaxID=1940285 RepID=UPI003D121349
MAACFLFEALSGSHMLRFFNRLSKNRLPWVLLACSALALEAAALYFQYQLKLDPCVLCVYERTAVMGIVLSGLIAILAPELLIVRGLAILIWGGSAGWGLQLALKHTGIQLFPSPSNTCDFVASYPGWAKLDEWIPWMFQPTGFCDEIQWQFFGFTMPQTMIGVYAVYLLILLIVVLSQFVKKERSIFRN